MAGFSAPLLVGHLEGQWGLRSVPTKGGKVQDIPVPAPVLRFLHGYVEHVLIPELGRVTPETPLFWSTWGRKIVGKIRQPMVRKNVWRLCKVYGSRIGHPTLKGAVAFYEAHALERWRGPITNAKRV